MKILLTTSCFAFIFLFVISGISICSGQDFRIHQEGFVENRGQIVNQFGQANNEVLYLFRSKGINIQLRKCGFSYEFKSPVNTNKDISEVSDFIINKQHPKEKKLKYRRIDIELLGANPACEIIAEDPLRYYMNFYNVIGAPEGIVKARTYSKVVYRSIYPNIDLEFSVSEALLDCKYSFIIHPGGSIENIRMRFNNAFLKLEKGKDSSDVLCLLDDDINGNITIPLCYNISGGHKQSKGLKFNICSGSELRLSVCDSNLELKGDMQIMYSVPTGQWATYIGGDSYETGYDVVIDKLGYIYAIGTTGSKNNIATSGSYQDSLASEYYNDIFIIKFDSLGNRIWGTYLGGEKDEGTPELSIDGNSNLLMAGTTGSEFNIATTGAHQEVCSDCQNNGKDAFLVKLNSNGYRIWGTYFGGDSNDWGSDVTTDEDDNIFICGTTESASCIASSNALYNIFGGGLKDAFLAKFDSGGNRCWSTYYGGADVDEGYGVVTIAGGYVFITGMTLSSDRISHSGFQNSIGGCNDAFLAKLNPDGTINWGTYFGSGGGEYANCIAQYQDTYVYIAGFTSSSGDATPGVFQETHSGGVYDGFIEQFSSSGNRLWGTYYGGEAEDKIFDISVNSIGYIYVIGRSFSNFNIASPGSYLDSCETCPTWCDTYFGKFDAAGQRLSGSYYGGEYNDQGLGITTHEKNVYIIGFTGSLYNIASDSSFQTHLFGPSDAYLARFVDTFDAISTNEVFNSEFIIYPCPTNNLLFVDINSNIRSLDASIIDNSGQLLLSANFTNDGSKLVIPCGKLSSGIYILTLTLDQGRTISAKFIKQ